MWTDAIKDLKDINEINKQIKWNKTRPFSRLNDECIFILNIEKEAYNENYIKT